MTHPISSIKDIAPDMREKLTATGIRTMEMLLERAKSLADRERLAKATNIAPRQLLDIANLADRMRIKGVGVDYARLLQKAGVNTVRELRYRNPANLAKRMADANRERQMVRILPSEQMVERWIEQARELPLMITY